MIEQPEIRLGFIALTDCAPLAVAKARGLFAAEGLTVELSREPSWANIRDKLHAGVIDGAHMLAPMVLASSLGVGGPGAEVIAPLALNSGGSSVAVSMSLAAELREASPGAMDDPAAAAQALGRVVELRRVRNRPSLRFAAVFPHSMHAYVLRYWMAQAGVDPDRDVRLVFTPPARMAARLRSGEVDGICVGAPWGELSAAEGAGAILFRAADFWPTGPDKVLGVLRAWADGRRGTLQALLRALIRAQLWADAPENREALAALLAAPEYVDAPRAVVLQALEGSGLVFSRQTAAFPWLSHAAWFLSQMRRWGQLPGNVDLGAAARAVYRPDLFRRAAGDLGVGAPLADSKPEGLHARPWRIEGTSGPLEMPPDRLFDGHPFDPEGAAAYADGFAIGMTRAPADGPG